MFPLRRSTRLCRRRARPTARSASRLRGWPNSQAPNGSTAAKSARDDIALGPRAGLLAAIGPRLRIATSRRGLGRGAGIGFKHRAAVTAELRCILSQARNNPIGIRDLVAAKSENVGRAGKLLCKGSPILLGN